MKVCIDCEEERPLKDFHARGRGSRANCKYCRARTDRGDKLRRLYNIDVDTYNRLLEEQDGVCAACNGDETAINPTTGETKFLAVDHDHSCCPEEKTCGQCIRGLLCSRCNVVLGLVQDDASLLLDYIIYLRNNL